MDDRGQGKALLDGWLDANGRLLTVALLEEWARADPAFLRWCERTFSGVNGGGIAIPLSIPNLLTAADALRALRDGAGPDAVRNVLAPLWEVEFRHPYEAGV